MKIGELKRYANPQGLRYTDELVVILSIYHNAHKVMVLRTGDQICGVWIGYLKTVETR